MPAIAGRLSTIELSEDGNTFVSLGGIVDITYNINIDEIETTAHDSNGARSYLPNFDDQTLDVSCRWIEGDVAQKLIIDAAKNKTLFYYRFKMQATSRTFVGRAFPTSMSLSGALDDVAGADFTLRCTVLDDPAPALDLAFAETLSLTDQATGANLITFTRATAATYVGSDGLIKTAASGQPRFDHHPTTRRSLGLLIEEQRTNLLTYSEQFDNAAWSKQNTTVTANATTAPDGTLTAEKIVENTVAFATHILFDGATLVSGTVYTLSFYLKKAERSFAIISSDASSSSSVIVDLSSGSITGGTGTGTVVDVGNGWFRVSTTFTSAYSSPRGMYIATSTGPNSGDSIYTGDGVSGIYVWGAQLEAGAFPTSYIPTTTAAVTRTADQPSISGANFTSWYSAAQGTFVDESLSTTSPWTQNIWAVTSSNGANRTIRRNLKADVFKADAAVAANGEGTAQATVAIDTSSSYKGAIGYNTSSIVTSAKGEINTSAVSSVGLLLQWYSVAWAPELGLFCAVGLAGSVMTSPDGITWTRRTSAANNNWQSVTWAPELGLFCAVSNTGTGNRVMTSPNGITWTTQSSASDSFWLSVTWSPQLGLFCAVGGGGSVMTSPNGITWTSRTSASNDNWQSVTWAPELGLFCAVSSTGSGNRVMTSPNGITWTSRTSAADNQWLSVTWSPQLGLFCAVAQSGTNNRVMTSPDGITWTTQLSAADNNWYSVTWAPELGLFCAVANTGTGNRVMTSPDGTTWTTQSSAPDSFWLSVTWSPQLGLFCAVSSTGSGNRVMTSPNGTTWSAYTSATVDRLTIGSDHRNLGDLNGTIERLTYYSTRLNNAILQGLTSR